MEIQVVVAGVARSGVGAGVARSVLDWREDVMDAMLEMLFGLAFVMIGLLGVGAGICILVDAMGKM